MTEEELNKDYLKNRLKDYRVTNKLLNEILKINSEQYVKGLIQGKFDTRVVVIEALKCIDEAEDFWEDEIPIDILKELRRILENVWR